ncbi:TonB-dependent receptor [Duganella sp. PWIR1]
MNSIHHNSAAVPPAMRAMAAAITAIGALSIAAPSQGQTVAAPAEEGLQTIVVTAQKREQPLQKVPVAVNMVDAKAIENQQLVDFTDLVRVAPSLTINQGNGTTTLALRGIGTFAYSIGLESAVSVIIDDVPVVQQLQAFSNLSDLERVEVLRGPQGTLFGKNSSAGVLNVVTKESTDYFSGRAQATMTDDGQRRAELSLSGPISDSVAYRVNTYVDSRRGDITNLTTGADVNGDLSRGARARLDIHTSPMFKMKLVGDYTERRVVGPAATLRLAPDGARLLGAVPLAPALAGIAAGPENRNVRLDDVGYTDSTNAALSATETWKLDQVTVTAVTSYQDWKYRYANDIDVSEVDLLGAFTRNAVHGGVVQGGPYHSTQFTQELRLASNTDGAFSYLGGLYYSNAKNQRSFTRGPVALLANWSAEGGNRSLAAFAQVDYQLAAATRVSVGARLNRETVRARFTDAMPAVPATYAGESSDNAGTGKLALQHDLAKAVMVYASVASGYKGAGYDISTGFNQSRVDRPVAPESSIAYEAGVKSRFLNNRVQLNLTAFQTDYDDFQAQAGVVDPVTGVLSLAVHNVGKLRTRGLELELSARPVRQLQLEASAGYTEAVIRSFANAPCYPGQTAAQGCYAVGTGTAQDLAGKTLANAPRLKLNFGATLDFPLTEGGWGGTANLNYQYQSKVNFDLFQNPLAGQAGYGVVNGSLAFSSPERQWKITLFGNNLLNKSYTTSIFDNAGLFGGQHVLTQILPRNAQRYLGVRVKYEF